MIRNAVWVAHRLGFARPKVAVIAPVEVSAKDMPATADAALIAKMGEAGQIADADIAGPYAARRRRQPPGREDARASKARWPAAPTSCSAPTSTRQTCCTRR